RSATKWPPFGRSQKGTKLRLGKRVSCYFFGGISSYILRKIFHEPSDCFFQTSKSFPLKWVCFPFLVASPWKTEVAIAMSPTNWKLFQSVLSVNGTKSGLAKSFL